MSNLILPGHPLFDVTLATSLPPGWESTAAISGNQCAFVLRVDSGLMEPVSGKELDEYLLGGEYDARLEVCALSSHLDL